LNSIQRVPPSYCIYVFIKRLRIYKRFSVSFTFNKTLTHFCFHFNAFFEFLHKKTAPRIAGPYASLSRDTVL